MKRSAETKTTEMKESLKEQIYRYASFEKFINGGEFERLAMEHGYKSSNASRRCRDLVKENRFERKIINGSVWYKRKVINNIPVFAPKKPNQPSLLA